MTATDPDGRSALQVLTVTVEGPAVQPPPVIIEATPPAPPPLPTVRPVPAPAATLPSATPTPPATATPSPTEPPPTASPTPAPTPAPPEQPSGGFPGVAYHSAGSGWIGATNRAVPVPAVAATVARGAPQKPPHALR